MPGRLPGEPNLEGFLYTNEIFEDFVLHPSEATGTITAEESDALLWQARGWKITKSAGALATVDQSRLDGHLRIHSSAVRASHGS